MATAHTPAHAPVPPLSAPHEAPPLVEFTLAPLFKWVFMGLMGLTVLSLGVSFYLVLSREQLTEDAKGLIETCTTTWKMGFGAVVGLVGGKALSR